MEEVISSVLGAFSSFILKQLENRFKNIFSTNKSQKDILDSISSHIKEISNWSTFISSLDTGKSIYTDASTIKLHVNTLPRKYRSEYGSNVDETAFIKDNNNYVILGDPGAGKTTTVKRLIRHLLFKAPLDDSDNYNFPILILLREYNHNKNLLMNISDKIGLNYEVKSERGVSNNQNENIIPYVEDEKLDLFLPEFLDSVNCVIFLDGLDEVPFNYIKTISNEIEVLGRKLTNSKIILTCRSGDYNKLFDGFGVYEISNLDNNQIRQIAEKYLTDTNPFFERIKTLPYKDLLDRPILLTQILFIYNIDRDLPDKPYYIYKKIIKLLLEEWDKIRNIKRETRYSRFDPEIKLEFLSALSFQLTYKIKTKTFSEDDLLSAYHTICSKFNLPFNEALEVVREIESHNGLIVTSKIYTYEFCHLSLQEYLCAYYIIREQLSPRLKLYSIEYPAPIAVSVALASEPSIWLANLSLRYFNNHDVNIDTFKSFMSRMILEQPGFTKSTFLGYGIIHILDNYYGMDSSVDSLIKTFLNFKNVEASLAKALEVYAIYYTDSLKTESFELRHQFRSVEKNIDIDIDDQLSILIPNVATIQNKIIIDVIKKFNVKLWCFKNDDKKSTLLNELIKL